MTSLTCPNCRHLLQVTDKGPQPSQADQYAGTEYLRDHRFVDDEAKKAYLVVDLLVHRLVEEGIESITSRDAMERYDEARGDAPRLNPQGLARAFKAFGCQPYRTATARGFRIPEEPRELLDLGSRRPVPHVKGRTRQQDWEAFHAVDRTVDGEVVPDPEKDFDIPSFVGPL